MAVQGPHGSTMADDVVSLAEHNRVFGVLSQLYAAAVTAGLTGPEVERAKRILFPAKQERQDD